MKIKLAATVILLTVFSTVTFCQKVNVGIKAGTDLHKVTGKSFDEEFKFGYHVGAFAEIKVKKIGIQPEVYFSQVSTNTKTGTNSGAVLNGVDAKLKFSYLNIPILANIYFNKNVALQAGPQFGIVMNESNSIISNGEDAFKKGDFSLVGGLQVKVLKFIIFGRYIVGLNNRNDIPNDISNEKWKSQSVHLGLGYSFL